jgi:hypothetical protein
MIEWRQNLFKNPSFLLITGLSLLSLVPAAAAALFELGTERPSRIQQIEKTDKRES